MSLLTLPNELLLLVADFLPITSVSGLRRTCKRVYRVLKKLNRKRIVLDDIVSIADLEPFVHNLAWRTRLQNATALEISAITVLPPMQTRSRQSLASFLTTVMSKAQYFSLYLVPECDISYIPPPAPSTPLHPTLTHLSIINFRITPAFLSMFPSLVEATITLILTPLQNDIVQLQYGPRDVQAILLALPSTTMQRLTVTCTNLPPELLALAAQRFPHLTHLSFVWADAPDRMLGGVETTDISRSLQQYAEAIAPLSKTLQALYLPACVGIPSFASKFAPSAIPQGDELLGEGGVLLSAPELTDTLGPRGFSSAGLTGINRPLTRGRVSVGLKCLLDACRTLVKGVGGVRRTDGTVVGLHGMYELVKIGWLIPQGDGMPLLPIECVRRRGVVKFGAPPALSSVEDASGLPAIGNLVLRDVNVSSRPSVTGGKGSAVLSSLSSPTTRQPNTHIPRSVPITHFADQQSFNPAQMTAYAARPIAPGYREETEYWYPNMEWVDACAWPAFSEIEAVFPRPAFMRY